MSERITTFNVRKLWGNQFKSVQRWLSKIQRKDDATYDLYRFCQWTQKTPDELLALKEDPRSMEAETLLDDFKISEEYTPSVRSRILNNVKSFFKANYRALATSAGVVEYVKVKPYHKITKEDLYKVWRMCFNPRDRFVLSLMFSSGIARESVTKLTWGHLEDGWENQRIPHISLEPEIIKGHGRGKYKGVRQETFITPSAKRDLLEYKAWVEQKLGRPLTKADPLIFTTEQPYQAISYTRLANVFITLQRRSEVSMSPHDARRYVETALENAGIHTNLCRKIRGRKVRGEEAPYSQPSIEELRIAYAKALDTLEFQIEKPAIKPEDIRKEIIATIPDEEIEPIALKYGISVSEARQILRTKKEVFKELWSARKVKAKRAGGDCQRIVSEEELEGYLASGWRVQALLPSGRIVVSNER